MRLQHAHFFHLDVHSRDIVLLKRLALGFHQKGFGSLKVASVMLHFAKKIAVSALNAPVAVVAVSSILVHVSSLMGLLHDRPRWH
jgi:hypothetical protein